VGNYLSTDNAKTALKEIIEVYNDDTGAYDSTRLDNDIDAAEAEVNSGLTIRYTIPATSSTGIALCESWTLAILRSKAYSRLAMSETPIVILAEAKAARSAIRMVGSGAIDLPGETEQTTTGLIAQIRTTSNTPQMTRAKLAGF